MSRTNGHRGRTLRELWNPRPLHRKRGAAHMEADKIARKIVVQAERAFTHRECRALELGALDPDSTSPAWVPMGGPNCNG